jgi:hypothetical protein
VTPKKVKLNKIAMGFFSELVSGVVKVAITPIAVVKEVVNVTVGIEPTSTKDLLDSAEENFSNVGDIMMGEDI